MVVALACLAVAHVVVTLFVFSANVALYDTDHNPADRRYYARCALLSPLWPIWFVKFFAQLIKEAR